MSAVESLFDIYCVLCLPLHQSSGRQVTLNWWLVYAVGVQKVEFAPDCYYKSKQKIYIP
jgi:hypothetical protein